MPDSIVTHAFAQRFAEEWIAAWNAHDLERILSHYTEDFEMASPIIAEWFGEPSGILRGKAAVRSYWAKALERVPDLKFELVAALACVDSVTIVYNGRRGLSAEVVRIGAGGKVTAGFAHYSR